EVDVVVERQAGRVRGSPVDLDRVVLARCATIAAGVEEDIVPEAPRNGHLGAVEGVRSTRAGGRTAADVNAIVKEAIRAEGLIDTVDAGCAGIGRGGADRIGDARADRDHVVAVDGRP